MSLGQQAIVDVLLKGNYVTKADLAKVKSSDPQLILDYLLSQRIITKDLLGQAIAEAYHLPYADLNSNQPGREQVLAIPEEIAKKYRIVLFKGDKKELVITTDSPGQAGLQDSLAKIFPKQKITLAYSLTEDVSTVLNYYRKSLATRFANIISTNQRVAPEIVEEMIEDALSFKASDIHFEPEETEVIIRFRVDGVLQEAGRIPKEYYENILNRIKVQAHLRTDEHFAAQDGSVRYAKNGQVVDMRISIIPILDGEKVVARILSQYIRQLNLDDLGLSPEHEEILLREAQKPFGMILVAGPTGSGKTTTLYALLKLLNKPDVNITTIEDPVEYKINGVNQIQVNNQTDLTFAKGLRSIVRQDPDIILVGEIRDEETAEIAVNSALTGHLLLSTFHANDAATAIPRLLDMGVEPFILGSTLNLILAQRLARRICEHCRYSTDVSKGDVEKISSEAAKFFKEPKITLYQGKGCNLCGHTGYHGRVGIFEIIEVTPLLEALILTNPSKQQIWKLATDHGARPMFSDGLAKVKAGLTTLEELLRVVEPPKA